MCLGGDSYESPTNYYNSKSVRRSEVYGGGKVSRDRGTRYKGNYPGESGGYGRGRGRRYGNDGGSSYGVGKSFGSGYGGFEASSSNGVGFGSIGGGNYNPSYYSGSRGGRGKTTYGGRGRGGNKGGVGKYPPITQRKTPIGGKGISTTIQQRKMGYRQRDY